MTGLLEKYWLIIAALLLLSLIIGITVLATHLFQLQPVEISLADSRQPFISGDVNIEGAVYRPGLYPVKHGDSLEDCVSAAGLSGEADLSRVEIYVPSQNENSRPQKINLNRAEAWLLQVLPGIGEGKANAIIVYRTEHGNFRSVDDLLQIEGFGKSTVDKIRSYIDLEE
jgi:comEA protein